MYSGAPSDPLIFWEYPADLQEPLLTQNKHTAVLSAIKSFPHATMCRHADAHEKAVAAKAIVVVVLLLWW